MRMSVLIILLCVQRTLTIEPVHTLNESKRIKRDENEPRDEKQSKDQFNEQYEPFHIEYEDEDISDGSNIDKSSMKEERNGEEYSIKNNNASNNSSPSIPELHEMIRLVRAALPSDNSSKAEEAETDNEEEEDFEEAENVASTEQQYEAELYEGIQSTNMAKLISVSERPKRYHEPIDAKNMTESSSSDLIQIGDDESLNENDREDYGEFYPTRKEVMTLRSRQRRITSRSSGYSEIPSITAKPPKSGIVKDNILAVNDKNESKQMLMKGVINGRKQKQLKTKEKLKTALKNGRSSDFEELKQAYNALVCSVENFMALANKTMLSNADDNNKNGKSSTSTIDLSAFCKNDSSTIDMCVTSTSNLECLTTSDDLDFESSENRKSEEDEDIDSNIKKKHKNLKMDYSRPEDPAEKSGSYIYNDYDSVDPGDYDTNPPSKSTSSRSTIIDRPKQLSPSQTTQNWKNKRYKENSKNTLSSIENYITARDVSPASRGTFSTNRATEEAAMSWTTFRYGTKIRLKPSKRHSRRMSTENPKIFSRRKYLSRHRKLLQEELKEGITQPGPTDSQMLRNISPSREGDTEIIELEYV